MSFNLCYFLVVGSFFLFLLNARTWFLIFPSFSLLLLTLCASFENEEEREKKLCTVYKVVPAIWYTWCAIVIDNQCIKFYVVRWLILLSTLWLVIKFSLSSIRTVSFNFNIGQFRQCVQWSKFIDNRHTIEFDNCRYKRTSLCVRGVFFFIPLPGKMLNIIFARAQRGTWSINCCKKIH